MSWSVGASGDSAEVAKTIEEQFEGMAQYPCPEPEEAIKQQARALIATALAGNIPSRSLQVNAWGSQSTCCGVNGAPDTVSNTLSISIS